ncbi:hypothetical protein [Tropicibacter naphthalenivorans]|uniref:Glycosyl transferase family 2 n=1 Tax=Tropicibacter naphthalenivorans TaxID=441103 RepID=A0A0P1G4L4_9RHOB|nr:hypothetical protein [Tropicibacter naphthalenivorans]CUH76608.1 hypothetical protein TRN7648_01025 [Tropicibacter naphthalenivorans]SMC64762.1 hypothetical protein SAMN04488093_102593 [Tropicibacter naphthalenivorans]
MAQAPATPKWHRYALRAAARFGLADRLRPVPSEEAALALRAELAGHVPPLRKQVSFLIPLVSPEDVSDWDAVTDRLNATLACMIAQNDPHWHAIICCQTRPPLPEDERIAWLPFHDETPGNDKWRKLGALIDCLGRLDLPPGYVMTFDADDLLRQGVVAEMLRRQAPGGYVVESGYVMDDAAGTIALADAPSLRTPLRKPFWKLCGSCAAVAYDPSIPQSLVFLREMVLHEHRMFPYLAALAGSRLAPLSEPAVLYVLNHGENFGARRGRVGFKTRFVERFRIDDPQELARIASGFPTD